MLPSILQPFFDPFLFSLCHFRPRWKLLVTEAAPNRSILSLNICLDLQRPFCGHSVGGWAGNGPRNPLRRRLGVPQALSGQMTNTEGYWKCIISFSKFEMAGSVPLQDFLNLLMVASLFQTFTFRGLPIENGRRWPSIHSCRGEIGKKGYELNWLSVYPLFLIISFSVLSVYYQKTWVISSPIKSCCSFVLLTSGNGYFTLRQEHSSRVSESEIRMTARRSKLVQNIT
jgi:hypothetical protein